MSLASIERNNITLANLFDKDANQNTPTFCALQQPRRFDLYFLKVKGGRKLDFALVPESKEDQAQLIEVKWSDHEISPSFKLFAGAFKNSQKIQLVQELKREYVSAQGIEVRKASTWLCHLS